METTDELLQRWRTQPASAVELRSLKTDPALQPRSTDCVSLARQGAIEAQSTDHIRCMALQLKASNAEPEPVLVARLPQGLFIVDGHHRLAACKRARRDTIPARVITVERHAAVMVSKVVNYGGEKLRLHSDQRADAAWQTITDMTGRGRRKLPKGISQRDLEARFGVSLGTVNKMLDRLRQQAIDPANYAPDHCDPGTGWPRWHRPVPPSGPRKATESGGRFSPKGCRVLRQGRRRRAGAGGCDAARTGHGRRSPERT